MALDPRIVLLLGAETAIVDESSYARTLTLVGNAARTTAQFKYGAASVTFDGAGDRVWAADSADFTLGAGDFTVEGWLRFVTKTTNQSFCGQWDNAGVAGNSSWFFFLNGSALTFRHKFGGANIDATVTWTPTLGSWYHLAADRSGTTLRVYVNGAVVATDASFTHTLQDVTADVTLGAIGNSGTFPTFDFNGQMDEVRITKGLAQYAGAFTPPTAAFPRTDPVAETVQAYVWGPL